jgi:hypothetical protein
MKPNAQTPSHQAAWNKGAGRLDDAVEVKGDLGDPHPSPRIRLYASISS